MFNFTIPVTGAEKRRIEEFVAALRTPCEVWLAPNSPFNSEAFETEFRSKLLTHHCFMGAPLFQDGFDSAFVSACGRSGCQVAKAPGGQRFWDVQIGGKRISLKSTKAKDLKANRLHISKLTEAAWIQDCRTAARRRSETLELFKEYCAEVDSIIQFRYFVDRRRYELMEILVSLFKQIFGVGVKHFSADGPTINIPIGKDPPDFTLKLDRSDAKIAIANINKDVCMVHGTWQL